MFVLSSGKLRLGWINMLAANGTIATKRICCNVRQYMEQMAVLCYAQFLHEPKLFTSTSQIRHSVFLTEYKSLPISFFPSDAYGGHDKK